MSVEAAIVVCFFLGVLIGVAIGIYRQAIRRNRLLNKIGYHVVELHNCLERAKAEHSQSGANLQWEVWENE